MTVAPNPADFDCDGCERAERRTRAVVFDSRGAALCSHCAEVVKSLRGGHL